MVDFTLQDIKNYELPHDQWGTMPHFEWQAQSPAVWILDVKDMAESKRYSDERVRLSRLAGLPDRQHSYGNADWRGYIGEWAVARWLGIELPAWPTMVRNPIDLVAFTGQSIDVKSHGLSSGQLGVFTDIDQPCDFYVLAIVQEASPHVIIVGWTSQKQLFQPYRAELRPTRTREEYTMLQYELFDIEYLREDYYETTTD